MTQEIALKACPFCGGPVNLEKAIEPRDMYGRTDWWGVVCRNTKNLGGSCAIQQRPSATKEAAISRWNTRAPIPADDAMLERVRNAIRDAIMVDMASVEAIARDAIAAMQGLGNAKHNRRQRESA